MGTVSKYKFDDFEADLRAAELRRGGARLKLQLQPFQVLLALLERPREVVTREELRQKWVASSVHQKVWPTVENTLSTKDYTVMLFDVS